MELNEHILCEENLAIAIKKVKQNKGAPGVTCIGETIKISKHVAKNGDEIIDVTKSLAKEFKGVGSYEIKYANYASYIGKGDINRAIKSAKQHKSKATGDITSIRWKSAPNNRRAFIDEYFMQKNAIDKKVKLLNKIWSPGRNYARMDKLIK